MSTRCNIAFYESSSQPLADHTALIYRHSDGYPGSDSGVLASLVPFLKTYERLGDAEYVAARALQKMTNDYDAEAARRGGCARPGGTRTAGTPGCSQGVLGYGISDTISSDIDYLYVVRCADRTLEVYSATCNRYTPLETISLSDA